MSIVVDGITSINNLYKVEAEKFDNAIQLKVWDKVSAVNLKPYAEAKKIAQLMNIRSNIEWNKLYKDNKIPKDIPSHPDRTYKNDWEGWGTFLNTGRVYKVDLPNLKKLTSFIQKKKIKSAKEYVKFWRQNKLKNSNC